MFLLPVEGERKAITLKKEDYFGRGGRLSPDGRLIAFNSNESGKFQIYVRPIDPSLAGAAASEASRTQVSADGGIGGIVWRKDAQEIFFLSQPPGQAVMVADVTPGASFEARTPRRLFDIPGPIGAPAQLSNIVSADGQRFIFAVSLPARTAQAPR
jgi:serine/threonine-protein kinase